MANMNIGDTFELSIHEKHLNTGVHEYMVWFDAMCEVIPGSSRPSVELYVDCDMPEFAHQPHWRGPAANPILTASRFGFPQGLGYESESDSMLDVALNNIRRGMEHALRDRQHGLRVRIHALRLHPVDFQPARFLQHSYEYTRKQLELMG